ncbi:APC membrane recruitment protein 1-like isoform 1-T3 [Spinachia spinachia]
MASWKVDEQPSDAMDLASAQLSRCGSDDITEAPQPDTMNAAVKSQKSGKFRRTALTFFGVRKSMCILPSFFGGRSKNLSKWTSKKGISKSSTHDGLSKVSHDDDLSRRCTSARDWENLGQKDSAAGFHPGCPNECSHFNADQKSLTLPRQRRGLRSLFQSFKSHRNHRNVGLDKTEMIAMSSPRCKKEVPVVHDNDNQDVTECLDSEPDVPDSADVTCNLSIGAECTDADDLQTEKSVDQGSTKSELDREMVDEETEEIGLMAVAPSELKESMRGHSEPCLKLQAVSERMPEKSETPAGSSEQLNLIYGDVTSLKSFDSLTGCGDIIADQEDDSITESSVSGERSKSGGKRASCYLTYQGGGEEMASPEDLDQECLHDFWSTNASDDICCTYSQEHTDLTADLTSSHNMDLLNSNSAQQGSGMDASSIADVLTPQSEHQESVPTSDEGYYDSTTPGPEDGLDKVDGLGAERLPRDSYSGDALYELFAPDESLISPHYESKSKLASSKQCEYLSQPVDATDFAFVSDMNRLQISREMYEVRDFLAMPIACSKTSEMALTMIGRQEMGIMKNCKVAASFNRNDMDRDVFDEMANKLSSSEKRRKSITADCEKRHSSVSFGSTSDPDFETFCEPKEQHLEENKPVALPYKNINSRSPAESPDVDDRQTVCFSQALVDYTKRSQMLRDSDRGVDGTETNSAFTPNMQALPTIVTFDVVDMHNEGEYDEQIHMELEEDISLPYRGFEESYTQKDAFAECDYQMLDMYEQNLAGGTWAIASLPRHAGLNRVSHTASNPLTLDRRSRSLDTDNLELKMPDRYRENAAAFPPTERDPKREASPYCKKNVLASEVRVGSSMVACSWQTRSEMALSLPLTDREFNGKVRSLSRTPVKRQMFYGSPGSDRANQKSQIGCSTLSGRASCGSTSQSIEPFNRLCHLPSQSDSGLPHVYSGRTDNKLKDDDGDKDIFCNAAANLQSYNRCGKRGGTAGPLDVGVSRGEPGAARDVGGGNL